MGSVAGADAELLFDTLNYHPGVFEETGQAFTNSDYISTLRFGGKE